jgi:8-oxo-dGTP pyrophosphatase MutT (NUDIX family)
MKNKFINVVLGIPFNHHQQVLLSQRHAPHLPAVHHKWQLIGGGVEFGETSEQTLAREFQEETQLSVEILFPHPIVKTSIWTAEEMSTDHNQHTTLIAYLVKLSSQKPDWSSDTETADMQWFDFNQVAKLPVLPQTVEIVAEAVELINRLKLDVASI